MYKRAEACRKSGIICTSVDGSDKPRDHVAKPNLIVHINGAIPRLTEERLGSTFKLVSQSYAADSFEDCGWAFHFRNDIRTASAVVFIGYSMYDLDLRRAIFHEDISEKCVFVIAPISSDNELDAEDLADLGVVAPIGVDALSRVIEATKATYSPKESALLLETWDAVKPIQVVPALPSDAHVIDFLTLGDVVPPLLLEACGPNKDHYVVPREVVTDIEQSILVQPNRVVLIVGDLGTGKSFVAKCVAQLIGVRGQVVFELDSASNDEIAEAEEICQSPGKKLVVVENYHRHLELLRWLAETKPADVTILLTARSSVHDLFAKDVYELYGKEVAVFDLSRLTHREVTSSVTIFDRYGLWGDRIAWNKRRKEQFVSVDCKSRLPYLLVDVLRSRHLTERYRDLIASSGDRESVESVLICAFSLEVMGFMTRTYQIQELLANRVKWDWLRAHVDLKDIMDFDAHSIRIKSSILASHLLHNVFSAKRIVTTLIGMVNQAEARRSERDFHQILSSLMRYGSVSLILPEDNRLEATTTFYEGIKNLPSTKANPQFWLQYAIACLAFDKLERAERYFEDAYSLAEKMDGYDTFQIDNHYARLLLEKALTKVAMDDVVLLVDDAKKIILRQMQGEFRYYPYRVALGLFRCFERFAGKWSPAHVAYFKRIFEEIKRRCEGASPELKKNNYVIDCLKQSEVLLGRI